ncbi:AvrD family protein [Rhodococcus sp. IEGM 1330]|uniref:AvrD family protein n=1 Tax=Rhodococcus sp. IEGM 1330 TaxID=3082225 RepID=UPI0029558D58|nr:AvrD family protein [Rhodococcus sp. IEGM 1330]MDV8022703.1 AvrD family protein [Rhodococcus sp. IEGM 1330]
MSTTSITQPTNKLVLSDISDHLGDPSGRFFSNGYKRATYTTHTITTSHDIDTLTSRIAATIDVGLPPNWSVKKSGVQPPHVSTVDAMVVAMRSCATLLTQVSPQPLSELSVVRVAVVGGDKPQETLDNIAVSGTLQLQTVHGHSRFRCEVGSLRVTLVVSGLRIDQIRHDLGQPLTVDPQTDSSYWNEGFRRVSHTISDVTADIDALEATGTIELSGDWPEVDGLEHSLGCRLPFVEAFVCTLQLAQVLFYALDGLSRSDSNTLWMMRTVITPCDNADDPSAHTAPDDAGLRFPAAVRFETVDKVPMDGGEWRFVEFTSVIGNTAIRAEFTHDISHVVSQSA